MKSIYVGNLPFTCSEDEVRDLFSAYGAVHSVKMISDRETGRPRGFAFVEMDAAAANNAISALNGKDLNGRPLRIYEVRDRTTTRQDSHRFLINIDRRGRRRFPTAICFVSPGRYGHRSCRPSCLDARETSATTDQVMPSRQAH